MGISATGWSNKNGTSDRACKCGTWKDHWVKFAKKAWPSDCSVNGCTAKPTLGAHVYHPSVDGEQIVPMCDSCNKRSGTFDLKGSITIPKANKAETCNRPA
jgi:hypothetical protein